MFEKLRSLTRASLVYGIGHILTRMVTFLLLPYYSHQITPAEYGEVSLYFLFLAITQTFFFYGLDIAYLRYFNLAKEPDRRRTITGTTFWTSLTTTVLLAGVILIASRAIGDLLIADPVRPAEVGPMIRLCAGILVFDTLSAFPFLLLRSINRPVKFTLLKLINVAINIGLNLWLVGHLHMSTAGILWANFVASFLTFLFVIPDLARSGAFVLDRPLIREMIAFGLPNIPTYLFVMIVELADRKIIELYRGIEEAGLYSAGYKLGMFMAVVTAAFRFAWQPFFLAHADDEDAPQMFARVLTYYMLIAGVLFLALTFFVDPLVRHAWPGLGPIIDPRYWAGLGVFPIILLAHVFDGVYANFMVGVYLKKLTRKLPLVTGSAALFTIVACLWLIPRFGMYAAAWITLGAFILQAALLYLVVRPHYRVPYEWLRLLKIAAAIGILTGIGYLTGFSVWWMRLLLLGACPLLLLGMRFFDSRELHHLRRLISRA